MPIKFDEIKVPRNHLVIPDEHYFHGDNFRRCKALGKYIIKHQPEVIVRLGDMWDMPSLCTYEKGKKEMVFRTVQDDLQAGHDAEKLIFGPLIAYNKKRAKAKRAQYKPIIIKLMGNHEFRVQRLLDYENRWSKHISMDMFKTRLPIKEVIVPFTDYALIDGVYYSHYLVSGVQGRPFASARSMITKRGVSSTMGHSHSLDHAVMTKPSGDLVRGIFGGCFQDPDTKGFGGTQVDNLYWNGIFMKHAVQNGSYDLEEIRVERLLEM